MNVIVKVLDKTSGGKTLQEVDLAFASEQVTVKDIIEARVIQEVDRYNSKKPEYFNGLVQPQDAEKTLNGYRMKTRKAIDPEKQVYIALNAYMKNGYFILIDKKQAGPLEEMVMLKPDTEINFVKLTPLVGG